MTRDNKVQNALIAALIAEDELGAVLRAHLYIEKELNSFLYLFFDDHSYFDKAKLEYSQKVLLAIGFGIKNDLCSPLQHIGKIRNDFAHKIDMQLDEGMLNNFYETFGQDDKQIMQRVYKTMKKSPNSSENKKKLNERTPRDRFAVYVMTLRAALIAAQEQVKSAHSLNDAMTMMTTPKK